MQKRKFTKKEIIALSVLIILMIAVIIVGAFIIVNNVNSANRKATDTKHTTIAIETPTAVHSTSEKGATEKIVSNNSKADNKSSKNLSSKSTVSDKSEKSVTPSKTQSKSTISKASKKPSTKSKTPPKSKGAQKVEVVTPDKNTEHKSDDKCKINGTTCYVGDTISVTLNLTVPIILENYQGYTTYDGDYLEYVSVSANTNGIVNNRDNTIFYNASVISGLDFTSTGTIYTVTFKVKKAGSTSIKNTLEVLTDKNDKNVSFKKAKDEIKVFG